MALRRTLIGVLLGGLFIAALIMATVSQTQAECEVCMDFGGQTECSTSRAADRDGAVAQALSSVCGRLSSGVTEVVRCNRTAPSRISCGP